MYACMYIVTKGSCNHDKNLLIYLHYTRTLVCTACMCMYIATKGSCIHDHHLLVYLYYKHAHTHACTQTGNTHKQWALLGSPACLLRTYTHACTSSCTCAYSCKHTHTRTNQTCKTRADVSHPWNTNTHMRMDIPARDSHRYFKHIYTVWMDMSCMWASCENMGFTPRPRTTMSIVMSEKHVVHRHECT